MLNIALHGWIGVSKRTQPPSRVKIMQIIGSKGHTFTPRFTKSKSVKMAANMAAKDPPGAKIRILIRLLLVSIHFNDRNLCFY